ncbi:MAG TPA: hypothetical protein VMW52_12680, partial [Phycisphaerae bacterium]|nr:hypothetical protein [Phycisphaerae bacterium]
DVAGKGTEFPAAALAAVWSVVGPPSADERPGVERSYYGSAEPFRTRHVPLERDIVRHIGLLEALAARWGVDLPGRPTRGQFKPKPAGKPKAKAKAKPRTKRKARAQ